MGDMNFHFFRAIFALVMVIQMLNHQAFAAPGEIFSAPPPQICAVPGDNITLACYLRSEGYWYINGILARYPYEDYAEQGMHFETEYINSTHLNMTITFVASYGISFECFASGSLTNQWDSASTELIVSNSPPNPPTHFEIAAMNYSTIELSWSAPFSAQCNPVIHYTVGIYNRSDHTVHHHTINNSADTFEYLNPNETAENCHILDFHISATNKFGEGSLSSILGKAFPVVPKVTNVEIEVTFRGDGTPIGKITFETAEVCPFQNISYVCIVYDEGRNSIAFQSASEIANECKVEGVLFPDQKYFVSVNMATGELSRDMMEIQNHDQILAEFVTTLSVQDDNLLVIIVGGSLGVVILVGAPILILVAVCICLRKRRGEKNETDSVANVENLKRKQKPTSLRPMVSNPIYEGPMYDSPMGNPLKPLISRQHSSPDSPRYFDTPPSLPPPRKASISQPNAAIISSVRNPMEDDDEMIKAAKAVGSVSIPASNEEYTTMQPISIAQTLHAQSSEAPPCGGGQEDEYVVIKS